MRCFVTGASGFIGAHLVHELVSRGHAVKVLLRPSSDQRRLAGLDLERLVGDVGDRFVLRKLLRGCEWCFHVAASYQLWMPDYAAMYATNVEGTRNVIEAAFRGGCSRIVYTSTVGCIGAALELNGTVTPADEQSPVSEEKMTGHYKRSKWQAEQVAQELAAAGAPVVIVNPSAPAGPGDAKPTPTGQVILDFLRRRLPGYLDTGMNWVHVRDVAVGHVLAAEKGRVGQRYILGHVEGNWTLKETLLALEEITGVRAAHVRVPYTLALLVAYGGEAMARLTGRAPKVPLAGVQMAKEKMFFNPAKAIRELGLPQTPPREALADAVDWFLSHGYVTQASRP